MTTETVMDCGNSGTTSGQGNVDILSSDTDDCADTVPNESEMLEDM